VRIKLYCVAIVRDVFKTPRTKPPDHAHHRAALRYSYRNFGTLRRRLWRFGVPANRTRCNGLRPDPYSVKARIGRCLGGTSRRQADAN
jgi:hypothetical protein